MRGRAQSTVNSDLVRVSSIPPLQTCSIPWAVGIYQVLTGHGIKPAAIPITRCQDKTRKNPTEQEGVKSYQNRPGQRPFSSMPLGYVDRRERKKENHHKDVRSRKETLMKLTSYE